MLCTEDFILGLFCRIDQKMTGVAKHPQAKLDPSEVVTLGVLYALKHGGQRRFYRWVRRDWGPLFPQLPDRTRLFRLLTVHQAWTQRFLAKPTVLGLADTYGIELRHPRRQGHARHQLGNKGLSNRRWIAGGKLGLVATCFGLICSWNLKNASVSDTKFRPLVNLFAHTMVVLTDLGFHGKRGDPPNLKTCRPHTWPVRNLIETVLSLLTLLCDLKKTCHHQWESFRAHLAFAVTAYNLVVTWNGLPANRQGFVPLTVAELAL